MQPSHQRYFSKWIEVAKTESTRDIRIARTVNAMVKKWSYSEMIRAGATSARP
ncbi:YdeI/OmpD-associated family protein [Flavihumibacter stibioxidans]|uniref:YdeI/OmpD-associated family protein n=1 Tax=Flavihumibacter stibioxidans TaxID=1834163 RepID=UPI001FEB19A8|nr:YdeI/OmpD-associated family protein [Flavihumibacter stibioxidans]